MTEYSVKMRADIWPHAQAAGSRFGVPAIVHPDDFLFSFILNGSPNPAAGVETYFANGSDSAQKLAHLVYEELGVSKGVKDGFRLAEFASGYGMVTRHLNNYLPNADVVSYDIHRQAMEFIIAVLNGKAILSHRVPEYLLLDNADVLFALSFFSHMPPTTFGRWFSALYNGLNPGGHLIFTTHGRVSVNTTGVAAAIPPEGYLFLPNSEQLDLDTADYGSMFVTKDWATEQIEAAGASVALYKEGYWWGHQDLYVVTKPLL